MTESNIIKLTEIFRSVLNKPEIALSREIVASDVDTWDSLNHVNLIIAIEQEFDLRFLPSEIGDVKSVGDLMDLIDQKC